jgi:hypothetical protein
LYDVALDDAAADVDGTRGVPVFKFIVLPDVDQIRPRIDAFHRLSHGTFSNTALRVVHDSEKFL